ncbi:MAG TPA: transposase, partial [Hyphomicrobium sp.]
GRAGPAALPDDPGEVFADSAYRGSYFSDAVHAKGGRPRIVATAMWGHDEQETLARLDAWNQPIHRVRGRIEKIFGTWKRCYGLRRMRWRGLAKASAPSCARSRRPRKAKTSAYSTKNATRAQVS